MPRYAITEKAGRFVAAHRNTGVGMVLELTEKQAEHELRLGSLVALDNLAWAFRSAPSDAGGDCRAGGAATARRRNVRGSPQGPPQQAVARIHVGQSS